MAGDEAKQRVADRHRQVAELSRLGSAGREQTSALYEALHRDVAPHRAVRDLAYGDHPRHRLDVHLPEAASSKPLPVVVFVHGGGFAGGDKGGPTTAFHDNIGGWAVRAGFIGVTMNYRLAPEHTFPAGGEDVGTALDWLSRHVADYGGDPQALVAYGHSAGAVHVATHLARRGADYRLAGAVLSSGIYAPALLVEDPYAVYYGCDATARAAQDLTKGLVASPVPLLVSVAEHDPGDFHRQALALVSALVERDGHFPAFVHLAGHNHRSAYMHVGTEETAYTDRLEEFVTTVTSAKPDPSR